MSTWVALITKLTFDADNLLCVPFVLQPPQGLLGSHLQVDDFAPEYNKDLVEWPSKVGYRGYTTKTRFGANVEVRKTEGFHFEVQVLHKMQGRLGVPELVAYYSQKSDRFQRTVHIYATLEYQLSPSTLTLKSKIQSLLQALRVLHAEGVQNGRIQADSIRWSGDEIKVSDVIHKLQS